MMNKDFPGIKSVLSFKNSIVFFFDFYKSFSTFKNKPQHVNKHILALHNSIVDYLVISE